MAWRLWPCIFATLLLSSVLAVACAPAPAAVAPTAAPAALALTLVADGQTRALTTAARTVGDALAEAGVALAPADEVEPPLATPLPAAAEGAPLVITIVRVTETTEVIPEAIPFGRQIVRSTELSPGDPPRLLQTGQAGLREVTVRIVYRDGLEAERWPTATTVVEPARDEIVMIGVADERDRMTFIGTLAYIDQGRAIVLEGGTDAPRQLPIEGTLDGRVFQLSPDGRYLLFTLAEAQTTATFRNELWLIETTAEATARPLAIENVLWAGWDPSALSPRIAYTTARSITLPPGWEASNDLWLLELPADGAQPAPVRLIESYAATYGWWGGQYAWGDFNRIAYAFADEVGLLTLPASDPEQEPSGLPQPTRTVLHTFTEFNTGADWAWVPWLSWSDNGRYLAFTTHEGDDPLSTERFDLRIVDTQAGTEVDRIENVGLWSFFQWSPTITLPDTQLAYLRALEPATSQDSGYVLWLAAAVGEEARRIYPPEGETALFARSQPLAWGPDPNKLAFIFGDTLHILDLPSGEVYRAGEDDTVSSHPTWAPYGAAVAID